MNNVLLSIIIISYAQEEYIREAIESVLAQKVNFKYELLIADDCSPDNTKKIIKEYEKKYPDIIKVLDRPKNLGATNNYFDSLCHTSGKYVTVLEGDDYWCNDSKIQKQVDFLESHEDYFAVSHIQEGRNLNNEIQGYFPIHLKKDMDILDVNDYIKYTKKYSSSSTLYRNFSKNKKILNKYKELLNMDNIIGDQQTSVFLVSQGKVHVFAEPMMVYRMRNNDGISNFNSSHSIDQIEYRCMDIYIKMEEYYKFKYSFYKFIKKNYTLGVAFCICKLKFKEIKKFNKICPKKYKWKIILLFPFTCVKILFDRFVFN